MSSLSIFRSLDEVKTGGNPCALAIGNFDGVHQGHQALLSKALQVARDNNVVPSVLTFDPHPTTIVAPERVPLKICSLDQRLSLLAKSGVESVTILPFTPELARLTPEEFIKQVLIDALQIRFVLVGETFRFGCQQAGTVETLRAAGQEFGFQPYFLPPVSIRGEIVSSSAIRRYLQTGKLARASRLLGRCFSLCGPVVPGYGIGRKETVPTLNLAPPEGLLIPLGVFITRTIEMATGRRWQSITNAGTRPTFGGDQITIETFLLSPFEPPTPTDIEVEFRRFIRTEQTFPDPQALRAQIMKDVARAQAYWRLAAKLERQTPSVY